MKINEILNEALKSKNKLFSLLDEFYNNKEYTRDKLKHPNISDETYGKKSMIYIHVRSMDEREKLETELQDEGFPINKQYNKGQPTIEVQVSYFKGYHWDE